MSEPTPMTPEERAAWTARATEWTGPSGSFMNNHDILRAFMTIDHFERLADSLFDAIKHGDAEHQAWLRQAIADHFADRPVQRPRGGS